MRANGEHDNRRAGRYKLRYFGISHQPKHVRDIASIVLTLGEELELDHIASWSERLGLTETWQEAQAEVRRMSDTYGHSTRKRNL